MRGQLREQRGHVSRVVQRAHLHQRLKQTSDKRHLVPVPGHVDEAGVVPQVLLRLSQQSARIVKQHHTLVAQIFVSQATESGANFNKRIARRRHQPPQGDALNLIFIVAPAAFPEARTVIRAFIIANRGEFSESAK